MSNIIVIEVLGGVVHIEKCPDDVKIDIIDHDDKEIRCYEGLVLYQRSSMYDEGEIESEV